MTRVSRSSKLAVKSKWRIEQRSIDPVHIFTFQYPGPDPDCAHGHQQLSLFNAHYDERCLLPIHVYDTATGCPVAIMPRPRKTPSGEEVRGHLRRIVRRIRAHWPTTKITIRGDGHYGRGEVMDWCEDNGLEYVFGLSGNRIFAVAVDVEADDIGTRRALKQMLVLRGYAQTSYGAKSWRGERRVCARIEATELGLDIRYVVTNITTGSAEHIYDTLYLRARPDGKSDQIAQEPAGVGSHILSGAARQSDAPHSAHRRLLVDARIARRHPQNPSSRQR